MLDLALSSFKYALAIWLLLLAVAVMRDVLRHKLPGLLRSEEGAPIDPERLVLLFATVGFGLYYALNAFEIPAAELKQNPTLPDVPMEMLIALFGAQGSFLGGKILRKLKELNSV